MAWRTKQVTTDDANHLLMVDVESNEENFQEAKVIFASENGNDVDASREFFFEIPNDNGNNKEVISTMLSLLHSLRYGYVIVVFFIGWITCNPMIASNVGIDNSISEPSDNNEIVVEVTILYSFCSIQCIKLVSSILKILLIVIIFIL